MDPIVASTQQTVQRMLFTPSILMNKVYFISLRQDFEQESLFLYLIYVTQNHHHNKVLLNTNLVTQISWHITLYLCSHYWADACLNETKYALLLGMEVVNAKQQASQKRTMGASPRRTCAPTCGV